MNWYLTVIKKYAVFNGRARRKEFWMFILFNFIFFIVASILDSLLGLASKEYYVGPIYSIYALFIILPYLAVAVRRLHDIRQERLVDTNKAYTYSRLNMAADSLFYRRE